LGSGASSAARRVIISGHADAREPAEPAVRRGARVDDRRARVDAAGADAPEARREPLPGDDRRETEARTRAGQVPPVRRDGRRGRAAPALPELRGRRVRRAAMLHALAAALRAAARLLDVAEALLADLLDPPDRRPEPPPEIRCPCCEGRIDHGAVHAHGPLEVAAAAWPHLGVLVTVVEREPRP
jgi:hypothetical protein